MALKWQIPFPPVGKGFILSGSQVADPFPTVVQRAPLVWLSSGRSLSHRWAKGSSCLALKWQIPFPPVDKGFLLSGSQVADPFPTGGQRVPLVWLSSGRSLSHQWTKGSSCLALKWQIHFPPVGKEFLLSGSQVAAPFPTGDQRVPLVWLSSGR